MHAEMELLQYIYKTADMGCQGIDSVMGHVEQAALQKELARQQKEYGKLRDEAEELISEKGEKASGVGPVAKTSADWMAASKLALNDSPSKIAEMTIQGTTMGITKTIKHLKDFQSGGEEARGLGERLLEIQEANVDRMKAFL